MSQAGTSAGTAKVQHSRECRAGGSPTCWGLHRRDASQYRHSQFRMVHSRGAVCAHTSCQQGAASLECIPVPCHMPFGADAVTAY